MGVGASESRSTHTSGLLRLGSCGVPLVDEVIELLLCEAQLCFCQFPCLEHRLEVCPGGNLHCLDGFVAQRVENALLHHDDVIFDVTGQCGLCRLRGGSRGRGLCGLVGSRGRRHESSFSLHQYSLSGSDVSQISPFYICYIIPNYLKKSICRQLR